MPWPTPNIDENEADFIHRCMADQYIQSDLSTQDQRLAVCYQRWDDRNKSEGINMERKTFTGVDLKGDKAGIFTASIATLNVIDKDKDVTINGAFPNGKEVLVSAYQHGSWQGGLPVGKGIIVEEGDQALIKGQFNLNSETGKEHYETVKFAPHLQEWSYGFIVKAEERNAEWNGVKVSRILKSVDVLEVSPVLRGAGVNTTTLTIKSDDGQKYLEQSETVLAAVSDFIERTKSLADLRRKEGRVLSTANRERIRNLTDQIHQIHKELQILLAETEPVDPGKALRLFMEVSKLKTEFMEVSCV